MAVGKDSGTIVPEHLRAAVEAPGFAEAARKLQWDAPAPATRAPQNDNADRAREQRELAQKTIEASLSNIRTALVNPNLTEAQRSELAAQQGQLEGLQAQLATGARGVDVQQVSAIAAQVANSVSATVASVSVGGGMFSGAGGAVQLAQMEQKYGLQSIGSARNYEEARSIYQSNMEKLTPQITQSMDHLKSKGLKFASPEEEEEFKKDMAKAKTDPDAALRAAQLGLKTIYDSGMDVNDPATKRTIEQLQLVQAQAMKMKEKELEAKVKTGTISADDATKELDKYKTNQTTYNKGLEKKSDVEAARDITGYINKINEAKQNRVVHHDTSAEQVELLAKKDKETKEVGNKPEVANAVEKLKDFGSTMKETKPEETPATPLATRVAKAEAPTFGKS